MTKEVDAREKELTHQVHREWLLRSLDQVKQLTPVLISGIKIYVTTKGQGQWLSRGGRRSSLVTAAGENSLIRGHDFSNGREFECHRNDLRFAAVSEKDESGSYCSLQRAIDL